MTAFQRHPNIILHICYYIPFLKSTPLLCFEPRGGSKPLRNRLNITWMMMTMKSQGLEPLALAGFSMDNPGSGCLVV